MDDNIDTYGILKLTADETGVSKILCFYNLLLYQKLLPDYNKNEFVKNFGEIKEIDNTNKYRKTFY